MSITLTNESKNTITITNKTKASGAGGTLTWNTAVSFWDNQGLSTWNDPRIVLDQTGTVSQKNTITITNVTKN